MSYVFCIGGRVCTPGYLAKVQLELRLHRPASAYEILDNFEIVVDEDGNQDYCSAYTRVREVSLNEYLDVLAVMSGQPITATVIGLPDDTPYRCYLFELVYEGNSEAVRFRTIDSHVPVQEIANL